MKNLKKIARHAQQGYAKLSAMIALAFLATFSFVASATAPTIGQTVSAAVEEYKEEALVAIFAFIVVLWTLKATGVLKPR